MSVTAGWYDNPDDPTTVRFWDGSAWTNQIQAKAPAVASVPPGWYPDADQSNSERWWDGAAWTARLRVSEAVAQQLPARRERRKGLPVKQNARPIDKLGKADARKFAQELTVETAELRAVIEKHGLRAFADIDAYREEAEAAIEVTRSSTHAEIISQRESANAAIAAANDRLAGLQKQISEAQASLSSLKQHHVDITDSISLQEVGLFDYDHPAQSSASLATELESVRSWIKGMVRDKRAVTFTTGFTFNNSAAQGKKFINDMSKVLLRAYNAEAENAVKATKAGNLHVAQTRLSKAAEQIANSGKMISLRITDEYHRLRLKELELANSHLAAVQRERELERERRAELREQQKAEAELRREKERLEKERAHYLSTLAALEANGDFEGAERIRAQLTDVDRAINDVDYRAANIRAGHVYVISNIGAFGENMVKIGMTRRLEPMDRVTELGDASVPFRFDVHALFFASDAVGIEAFLHRRFSEQRVNKVNLRREFFRVTPAEVLNALKQESVEIVEFTTEPDAPEYRASLGVPALQLP
jgi:hypothetical protein